MAADVDEAERRVLLAGNSGQSLDGRDGIVAGDLAIFLPSNGLETRRRYSDRPFLRLVLLE